MNAVRRKRRLGVLAALAMAGCAVQGAQPEKAANSTLIVGIDVSGSFKSQYDDAVDFASYYIYEHLHGEGGAHVPTALFVGSIGGERPGEPKAFHPINDFSNRTREEIASDLRTWFPPRDAITDFNVFFRQVSTLAKERGLILAPLNLVMLSDGIPDVPGSARGRNPIAQIDLAPLEYLSRSVTVRLLYASPAVGDEWKRLVKRKRVRLWTQEAPVMVGWRRQLNDGPEAQQDSLWKWVADNVDFRVRAANLF